MTEARDTLQGLSAEERADAESLADECLREQECSDFFACLIAGNCEPGCDFCWDAPGSCNPSFNGDDLGCDCGADCDFVDVDCGG